MNKKWFLVFFCAAAFILTQAGTCLPDPPHCQLKITASPGAGKVHDPITVSVEFAMFPSPEVVKGPASILVEGSSGAGMSDHSECQIKAVPGQTGSCLISFKSAGKKTIYASTSYETDCTPKTEMQYLINPAEGPATTAVGVYSTAQGTGKAMKFEAQVTGSRSDGQKLEGSVTFSGGTSPCNAPVDVSGKAACIQNFSSEGKYIVQAVFTPADSTLFLPSSAKTEYIAYGEVTITGTIKPNPAYTTSRVIVEVAVVNKDAGSSIAPEGEVQITRGCNPDGLDVPLVNGKATIAATCPNAGTKQIEIFFSPAVTSYFLPTAQVIGEIKVVEYEAPASVTGCIVTSGTGFSCVAPCPDPANYPEKCTP